MSGNANRNAVKHGLTSRTQLPTGEEQNFHEIQADLISTFNPMTEDELLIVGEMAFARTLSDRAYRLLNESIEEESRRAPEILDRQEVAAFDKLIVAYRKNPLDHQPAMMRSIRGVNHIISQWQDALDGMTKPNPSISLSRLLTLVASLGSSHLVREMTREGQSLVVLFLQSLKQTAPNEKPRCKVYKSNEFEVSYLAGAHELEEPLPHRGFDPWAELINRIKSQIKRLTEHRDNLKAQWDLFVESQLRLTMGLGLGSKDRGVNVRLMHRYALSHSNKFDRQAGRLRTIIDKRLKQELLEKKVNNPLPHDRMAGPDQRSLVMQVQSTGKNAYSHPVNRALSRVQRLSKEITRIDWHFDIIESGGQVHYINGVRVGGQLITKLPIMPDSGFDDEAAMILADVLKEFSSHPELMKRVLPGSPLIDVRPVSEFKLASILRDKCKDAESRERAMEYVRMIQEKLGRPLFGDEVLKCARVATFVLLVESQLLEPPASPARHAQPAAVTTG